MTEVLRHAEAITHPRDHAMVDTAMVQSLLEILGRGRRHPVVRLYRVYFVDGQMQFTLTTWSEGRAVHCEEMECDAAAAPEPMRQALRDNAIGHAALAAGAAQPLHFTWLPVSRDKELLGCIEVGMAQPPTPAQLVLIDGMRGLYANYLSLLRYSQVDTLTGLLNRKTFDDSLQRLLTATAALPLRPPAAERRRAGGPPATWLAVMDIDHFKRVNDTFGHLFGDEVLILVANVMRKVFRRKDRLFRFGGEEFVVLLRDTTEENALRAFERFRRTVGGHEFPQLGRVTISVGFTRVQPADSPTTLIGRADDALYYAKEHGRDQVQLHDRLAASGRIAPATVVHTEVDLF